MSLKSHGPSILPSLSNTNAQRSSIFELRLADLYAFGIDQTYSYYYPGKGLWASTINTATALQKLFLEKTNLSCSIQSWTQHVLMDWLELDLVNESQSPHYTGLRGVTRYR